MKSIAIKNTNGKSYDLVILQGGWCGLWCHYQLLKPSYWISEKGFGKYWQSVGRRPIFLLFSIITLYAQYQKAFLSSCNLLVMTRICCSAQQWCRKPRCVHCSGIHQKALLVLPVDTCPLCLAITWPNGVWCFSKCDNQWCCSSLIVWGTCLLHIPLTSIHSLALLVLAASISRWAGFPLNLQLYCSSIFLLSYLGLHTVHQVDWMYWSHSLRLSLADSMFIWSALPSMALVLLYLAVFSHSCSCFGYYSC